MRKLKTILLAYKEIHSLEKWLNPLSIIIAVSMSISPFINIWFVSKIVDLLSVGQVQSKLIFYVIIVVSINFILFFINNYLSDIYHMLRSQMYFKEQKKIATKLFSTEYKTLENSDFKELIHKHSEAQKRVYSSFVQLSWMLRDFISGLLTLIISIIIIFPLIKVGLTTTGTSFLEKPDFLISIFLAILIMVVIILIISVRMNKAWFVAADEYSKLDRIFYYFLNMFSDYKTGKEIRLYKEQNLIEHIATNKILIEGEKILRKASYRTAKSSSIIALLGATLGFGIYLFIGVKGLYGLFSIGSMVLYCGVFIQILSSVTKMTTTFGKTEEILPLCKYYFDIISTEDDLIYGNKNEDFSENISIEFKHVYFKYPNASEYVLKDVNIKINDKEHIAIVGQNGSGKTTFIKVLCRLYDVTSGEILINGFNIKDYSKESLMKLYSVVFQDFKIFSFSVFQNLSASNSYDYEKMKQALDKANIIDRVMKMPSKEKTFLYKDLEKDGIEISGGEAQKLAFARALYKDAPIVVLDEPTAALDPIAESEIYNNFNSFVKNKTAIYISHRLSSCAFCDNIIVFDNGEIVEYGNHNELIELKNLYFSLWNAQAKYYTEEIV